MSRPCREPGCLRAVVPTSRTGTVHAYCDDHEREALSVFGEHWHDQARAGVLRPAIVGGVPVTTRHLDRPVGAQRVGPSPRPASLRPYKAAALASSGATRGS